PQIAALVGAPAGRAARDLRGAIEAHRRQPRVPAAGGAPALPRARPRRAVRLPDLVRVRPRACQRVRGPGAAPALPGRVELRRARGRYSVAALDRLTRLSST